MIATNMSNETQGSLDSLFQCVRFTGADHRAFLQAQLGCDLKSLPQLPAARLGAWLNPKGRALAMAWWIVDEQETLAITTTSGVEQLTGPLKRYVLRSKTQISHASDLSVFGELGPASRAPGDDAVRADAERTDDGWRLALSDGRHLSVSRTQVEGADLSARWTAADIISGIPQIHEAGVGEWIAQAIGLERLGAVSVRKGCYPGQEIVARMHFLGRGKRRLAHGTMDGTAVKAGTDVCNAEGKSMGSIVQSAADADCVRVLVTIHEDGLSEELFVNARKIANLLPF